MASFVAGHSNIHTRCAVASLRPFMSFKRRNCVASTLHPPGNVQSWGIVCTSLKLWPCRQHSGRKQAAPTVESQADTDTPLLPRFMVCGCVAGCVAVLAPRTTLTNCVVGQEDDAGDVWVRKSINQRACWLLDVLRLWQGAVGHVSHAAIALLPGLCGCCCLQLPGWGPACCTGARGCQSHQHQQQEGWVARDAPPQQRWVWRSLRHVKRYADAWPSPGSLCGALPVVSGLRWHRQEKHKWIGELNFES